MMIKILFICHGNICRSPMAEFVMKELVRKAGVADRFEIASAGVSREEEGNNVYPPVRRILAQNGIPCGNRAARQMTKADYDRYDYLICMDSSNLRYLDRIVGSDPEGKVSLLLEHAGSNRSVTDPYYSGDFNATWDDVQSGCIALLNELLEKGA